MKLAVWISVLALTVALIWIAARESEPRSVAAPAKAQDSSEAPKDATALAPIPSESAVDERKDVATSAPNAATTTAPDLVVVQVIERTSKRPIADARVHVLELEKAFAASELRDDLARLEELAMQRGKAYRSDSKGAVAIARVGRESILFARTDELFGMVEFNKYRNAITVELELDDSLSVQTVDARGVAIGGIPVSVRAFAPGSDKKRERVRAVTDAQNGKATIAHARFVVARAQPGPSTVCADVVSESPVEIALDPNAWPTTTVVLRLPRLGSVLVRVLDVDGTPMKHDGLVRLLALHPNESNEQALWRIDGDASHIEFRGGAALFEFVEVGTKLLAEAFSTTPELVKRADGPRAPLDRVQIDLGGVNSIAELHGRILGADGMPIVNTWIPFTFEIQRAGGGESTSTGDIQLDADGEFRVQTEPSSGEAITRVLSFRNREPQGSAKEASVELHVDGDLPGGVTELGDVQLAVKPLVIDGDVIDDEGTPVKGAQVQFFRPNGAANRRGPWIEYRETGASTDADGRFALRADWSDAVVGVQVRADSIVARGPLSFAAGSNHVHVRVERAGTIEGTALIDDDAKPENFSVGCVPEGAPPAPRLQDSLHALPEPHTARFSIHGVPPGDARVNFTGRGGSVLLALESVRVTGGKRSDDPRLKDVDLRGLSHVIHVSVHTPSGNLAANAVVRMRARDGSRDWSFVLADEGRATVNLRALPVDFVIGARGWRTKRVEGVNADVDVTLDDGIPIEFALDAGSRAALPESATIAAHLERGAVTSTDEFVAIHEMLPIDAAGRATVKLGEPGRYRPDIRLARLVDGQREWLTLDCTPAAIEVRDSTEVQKFDVALSPGELARAKAFLDGQ